jgi:hypothetical protein
MANEATLYLETELPVMMTCANGTGIEKGALLMFSSPLTVATHDGTANASFAGVAAEEKIANDGKDKIAVYRGGWFKMTVNAAITAPAAVAFDGVANKIKTAVAANVAMDTIGFALESCDAQDDTILVEVRPGCNNNAYA